MTFLVIENCKKISTQHQWHRRRQQIIGGGGAPINKSRRRRPQIVGGGAAAHGSSMKGSLRMLLTIFSQYNPCLIIK